jgi:pimeloyl-ACP methyl ester carboxylesterase
MKSFWLEKQKSYLRYMDTEVGEKTLVFIHGLGSSSVADFSCLLSDERFNKYRIILIELLGHGFSDKPKGFGYGLYDHAMVVANLLDHLGIKDSVVIGHSLGGTIAIALTQKRSDLVSCLIVAEPNLDPGAGTGSKIIAAQDENEFIEKGYRSYLKSLCIDNNNNSSESIYSGTFALADPAAIHRSAVGLLKGTEPPQRVILKSLKIPHAYIMGDQNIDEVPYADLTMLGFQILVVPSSGHAMMNDNPTEFKKIILKVISF